jgi:hypothetical protein
VDGLAGTGDFSGANTTSVYWTQQTDFNQYDPIGRRFMLGVRAKL